MNPTTQIAAATDLPQAVPVAAPFPRTHGNRGPVEAGETPAPGAPIREDGGAVVGVETPGAGPLDWFTSRLAGVYALERRFRLTPKESL